MDWFDKTVAVVWLVLTYQQNRILRAGNPPTVASQSRAWSFVHYWPTGLGVLIAMVIFLRPNLQSLVPVLFPSPQSPSVQSAPSSPAANHIGTTFGLQLAQMLDRLPKPCAIKVTDPNKQDELSSLIRWVVSYGNPSGGAICSLIGNNSEPPNIDNPPAVAPTTAPGMVVHWDFTSGSVQAVVHFFDSAAVKVSISHRLPPNAPPNFIWIDIGPGSPWK